MDPLSVTASIIAILQLTTTVSKYLHDAKDASTERNQFTTELSNLSRLLVTLLSHIDDSSSEPWHTKVRDLGGNDGLVYQYRTALEQLKNKLTYRHGIEKVTKTLSWKYVKDDVEHILSRIERLKSLVQIALTMDHLELSKAVESRMTSIQDDNKAIKVGVEAIQQDQDRQKHRVIMDWLSSADFAAQQSDHISRRQDETGLWFIDSHEFTQWVLGSSQTLFCPGIPGAGKTMMAAIAVDHLQKSVQNPTIGVAYLYCNYKRQAEQDTSSLLAAILKQLVQDRPLMARPLSSLYEHHEIRRTRPTTKELLSALQSVVSNYSRVYVVVDALDECSDRNGTRSQLLKLCHSLQGHTDLHLMATSRHIPDIEDKFKGMPRLEVRASNADMKRYVMGQLDRLPRCVQRDDDLQKVVQNTIAEAVDGMFLLARLHVDSLLDKRTKAKIISTLGSLSRGFGALDDAYRDAIARIDAQSPGDSALAKDALSWISYAQRPLTTTELCHALAVKPDDEELDVDNIPDIEDIVSVCAGLVTVDEESHVIRLVHYTTQEYLKGNRKAWNPSAQFDIAVTCLTYLCFANFRSGSCSNDTEFESRLAQNVLLDYSALYWGEHTNPVQEKVMKLAMHLLQDDNLVACVVQARSASDYRYGVYSQAFVRGQTGLHLAASLGLVCLSIEYLSRIGRENLSFADSKDNNGRTPLSRAASEGHKEVVQLLVERGDVEADSKDNDSRTPLWWAALRGQEAVVKLLVERADVEADLKNNDGRTPLSYAASEGHEAVVQLLVKRDDVEVDLKDNDDWTPLSYAALKGHKTVVQLLVERADVEVDSKNNYGRTPLSYAASEGHEAVVQLLVERDDVEADSKDNYGRTLLSYAALEGHKAVVKLLVERDDVEADSKDNYGRTPLSYAALKGHKTVVQLLVERDDVEAGLKDNYGQTPLSYAALRGHKAVVQLLVERDDVEADSKDRYGRTPLSYAALRGHEAVVQLLVKRDDVEADLKDKNGRTPLSYAAIRGHKAVVQLLVERDDVEADSKDKYGRTPLSYAALEGHEVVVKLLSLR